MKKWSQLVLLLVVLMVLHQKGYSQSFKQGLEAFEQKNYTEAIRLFSQGSDEQSSLFLGKSLFLSNRNEEARLVLSRLFEANSVAIKADALFTSAQISVTQQEYATSLDLLHRVSLVGRGSGKIEGEAKLLFNRLNSFLGLSDRLQVMRTSVYADVLFQVIKEGIRIEVKQDATVLLEFGRNLHRSGIFSTEQLTELQQILKKNTVKIKRLDTAPPEGFHYTIGVVLPTDKQSETFAISQHLYQGLQTAVELYNQQQKSNRVFLAFKSDTDSLNPVVSLLANESANLIVGPLTSNAAKEMVRYAEEFQTPIIAPLANNDSLNNDNPYFFQINPTFGMMGRRMAEFAYKTLNVDTVAVLADKTTLGYQAALAFKEEMQRLGVAVAYFYADDFKKSGFNMSAFTQPFTSDPVLKDSLKIPNFDAVYLPFTGEFAQTMIDLTLTDLEAQGFFAPILGSQDWGYIELPPERLQNFTFYYPDTKEINEADENVIQFRTYFSDFSSTEPTYFSYLGFDLGQYLTQLIHEVKKPAEFKEGIKRKKPFYGITTEIQFNGGHVNQVIYIYKSTKDGIERALR